MAKNTKERTGTSSTSPGRSDASPPSKRAKIVVKPAEADAETEISCLNKASTTDSSKQANTTNNTQSTSTNTNCMSSGANSRTLSTAEILQGGPFVDPWVVPPRSKGNRYEMLRAVVMEVLAITAEEDSESDDEDW